MEKASILRGLDRAELLRKVDALKLEVAQMRVQSSLDAVKKSGVIKGIRKDIARCLTVLSEFDRSNLKRQE